MLSKDFPKSKSLQAFFDNNDTVGCLKNNFIKPLPDEKFPTKESRMKGDYVERNWKSNSKKYTHLCYRELYPQPQKN